ncbi:MAG: efflux transporter periplasmic adaptor subunit, partial [Sphingobacteriales bacterium]
MDRVIQKKTWSTKRLITIAGVTGVVLLVAGSIFLTSGKSKLNVDTERITVSDIK